MSVNRITKQFISLPVSRPIRIADFNPYQKITFPNIAQFASKIFHLRQISHDIDVIADFDHTLTRHKYNNKSCDSLFGMWVRNEKMSQPFKRQLIENYMQYGPYETDSTISFTEKLQYVHKLYEVQTSLFSKHNITNLHALEVLQNCKLVFRSHTVELLEQFYKNNLPLYIVSGGISDMIYNSLLSISPRQFIDSIVDIHSNKWTVAYQKKNDGILEQFLKFQPKMIHSYNKHLVMSEIKKKKQNCILLGDLKSDIYMAHGAGYQTVLSIFYGKEGDIDQRALAQFKFDVIVEGDSSHKIVIEIIKLLKRSKQIDWPYLYRVNPLLTQFMF